jgi:hypothetical protein
VFWAIIYATLREEQSYKKFFGVVEILIAAALTFYQLTKLSESGVAAQRCSRPADISAGSVALMSKGMKDVYAGEGK